MTYKVFITVELTETYDTKEAAMDAAVEGLRCAAGNGVEQIVQGRVVESRVFKDGEWWHDHDFLVDLHDGAI
jgi:hypothetical protein